MTDILVPPIPASCANRPTSGGLVQPYVNVKLADGGVDFRGNHQTAYAECWTRSLCQTCGEPYTDRAVIFGGPNQLRDNNFTEPPLCIPCAMYATQACPMVAGRRTNYADREHISDGKRGQTCSEPGCDCGGWQVSDPARMAGVRGELAHRWYAVYIHAHAYEVLAYRTTVKCSDKGCEHDRTIVNGGRLTLPPLKVMLVSEPGEGRIWRRLTEAEIADVMPSAVAS